MKFADLQRDPEHVYVIPNKQLNLQDTKNISDIVQNQINRATEQLPSKNDIFIPNGELSNTQLQLIRKNPQSIQYNNNNEKYSKISDSNEQLNPITINNITNTLKSDFHKQINLEFQKQQLQQLNEFLWSLKVSESIYQVLSQLNVSPLSKDTIIIKSFAQSISYLDLPVNELDNKQTLQLATMLAFSQIQGIFAFISSNLLIKYKQIQFTYEMPLKEGQLESNQGSYKLAHQVHLQMVKFMKQVKNNELDICKLNTSRLNLFHLLHPVNYKSIQNGDYNAVKLAFPILKSFDTQKLTDNRLIGNQAHKDMNIHLPICYSYFNSIYSIIAFVTDLFVLKQFTADLDLFSQFDLGTQSFDTIRTIFVSIYQISYVIDWLLSKKINVISFNNDIELHLKQALKKLSYMSKKCDEQHIEEQLIDLKQQQQQLAYYI